MVGSNLTRTVLLRTYKKDEQGMGIDGESTAYKFPVNWLKQQIAPQDMMDFMGEYTYDDTEYLLDEAQREGITVEEVL